MSNLWMLCLADITKAENKRGCPMNGAASFVFCWWDTILSMLSYRLL